MHQSISLLHVKDPLFKRMGASRLARFAVDGMFLVLDLLLCIILNDNLPELGYTTTSDSN